MSDNLITGLISVLIALVGLASLSVILSPKAQTSQVLQAGSQGFAADLNAATSPVTGNSGSSLTMPTLSMQGV